MKNESINSYGKMLLFTTACIAVDIVGSLIARFYDVPLWMDCIGTCFAAYAFGPVAGMLVGVTTNIILWIVKGTVVWYLIPAAVVGLTVGIAARKKWFEDFYHTMVIATLTTILVVATAIPVNFIFNGARTGNAWGNALVDFFLERRYGVFSYLIGQFYVDFFDKTLTIIFLFLVIHFRRKLKEDKDSHTSTNEMVDNLQDDIINRDRDKAKRIHDAVEEATEQIRKEDEKAVEDAEKIKTMTKIVILLLIPSLIIGSLKINVSAADDPQIVNDYGAYIQTVYDNRNGLPCGEANDICQTPDGVLWIGTYAGLYRYSGKEFRPMTQFESVRNVNCLYTDYEGRVWIGTNDSGVALMIDGEIIDVIDTEDGLPSNSIQCIHEDSRGDYYIGTTEGVVVYTLSEGLDKANEFLTISNPVSIDADEFKYTYIVDSTGAVYVIEDRKIVQKLVSSNKAYTAVQVESMSEIYIATSNNTIEKYAYNLNGLVLEEEYPCEGLSNIRRIVVKKDTEDKFFCADNGVAYVDANDEYHLLNTNEFNNSIENMIVDYQGNLWFTSSRLGLLKFSRSAVSDIFTSSGTGKAVTNAVCEWQGNMYCGTDQGLAVIDDKEKVSVYNSLTDYFSGDRIRSMCVDDDDNLWICVYKKGVYKVSNTGAVGRSGIIVTQVGQSAEDAIKEMENPDNTNGPIEEITVDDEVVDETAVEDAGTGTIAIEEDYFDAYEGIYYQQGEYAVTEYTEANGLFGSKARVVIKLNDGKVAAAGDGGVTIFAKDGTVTNVEGMEYLAQVLCLCQDSDGRIYAGTDGSGIVVIKDGIIERKITSEGGLSSDVILKVVPSLDGKFFFVITSNELDLLYKDGTIKGINNFPYYNNYDVVEGTNGKIYVSGSSGVYVVNLSDVLENRYGMQYDLLNVEWGFISSLTANASNYLNQDEQYYVCSNQGIYSFNLNDYKPGNQNYRMQIAAVYVDGNPVKIERDGALLIQRESEKLVIVPEVINYTLDDPYVSYMLEGFDKEPTILPLKDLTEVTYTNLRSGDYAFVISVLSSDKATIMEEIKYDTTKEMAIQDTQIFMVYLVIGAALISAWITALIVATWVRETIKKQKEQIEFVEKQVKMGNETIMTIARALDARDPNTAHHSERVAIYSVLIAEQLGMDKEKIESLRKTALLHDIGKIGIPDEILKKPKGLTDEQYGIMKTHVTKGAEILSNLTSVDGVVEGALYHHEKYDGTGYVKGLKGEEIPLNGRIIGVADAFDAMTANRVYRQQLDIGYVLNEFEKFKGKQFDPQIADILLNLIHTGVIDLEKLYPPRPKDPDSEEKKEESKEETKPEEKKEENKVETSDKADNKAEEKTEEKTEEKADEKEGK